MADGNHRFPYKKAKNKVYTMKLSLSGDFITEYDELLLREGTRDGETREGYTFVALNVFRTEKAEGQSASSASTGEQNYAYGVYRYSPDQTTGKFDKNNIAVNLKLVGGYVYRFEATVLTEFVDNLKMKDGNSYSHPFRVLENLNSSGGWFHKDSLGFMHYNYSFEVSSDKNVNSGVSSGAGKKYLADISNGKADVVVGKDFGDYDDSSGLFHYPRVKRFYGKEEGVDPEELSSNGSTVINQGIDMKYKSFGLLIVVKDLPANTHITVADQRENKNSNERNFLIFPKGLKLGKDGAWEGLYSMNDLINESETIKLTFTWNKGGGNTETFPAEFIIKPKTRKIIEIDIEGSRTVQTEGNVVFKFTEDEALTDDSEKFLVTNKTEEG